MSANRHRGEVGLTLDGREIVLKPTFTVLAALEDRRGESLSALGRRVVGQGPGVKDVAAILEIAGGIKAAECAELIQRHGVVAFAGAVGDFLVNALMGGAAVEARETEQDAEKNRAAPAADQPTS